MADDDGMAFDFEEQLDTPNAPQIQAPADEGNTQLAIVAPEDAEAQPKEKNYRQTVCAFWLRGMCMKGDACGFLHKFDPGRMPVCRVWMKSGECKELECPFKHSLDDVKECNMYKLGFCIYGPNCRYKHTKQPGPPPDPEGVEAAKPREHRDWRKIMAEDNARPGGYHQQHHHHKRQRDGGGGGNREQQVLALPAPQQHDHQQQQQQQQRQQQQGHQQQQQQMLGLPGPPAMQHGMGMNGAAGAGSDMLQQQHMVQHLAGMVGPPDPMQQMMMMAGAMPGAMQGMGAAAAGFGMGPPGGGFPMPAMPGMPHPAMMAQAALMMNMGGMNAAMGGMGGAAGGMGVGVGVPPPPPMGGHGGQRGRQQQQQQRGMGGGQRPPPPLEGHTTLGT